MGEDTNYITPLAREHEALGYTGKGIPAYYGSSEQEELDFVRACADVSPLLADISDKGKFRIAGDDAIAFISSVFSCPLQHIPDVACSIEASFVRDNGEEESNVHIIRSGDAEFMLLLDAQIKDESFQWLKEANTALGSGSALKENCAILEEQSDALAGLLLAGPGADDVLSDLSSGKALPDVGQLDMLALDTVSALIYHSRANNGTVYEIYCSPSRVCSLWRALLSFNQVNPVGSNSVKGFILKQ